MLLSAKMQGLQLSRTPVAALITQCVCKQGRRDCNPHCSSASVRKPPRCTTVASFASRQLCLIGDGYKQSKACRTGQASTAQRSSAQRSAAQRSAAQQPNEQDTAAAVSCSDHMLTAWHQSTQHHLNSNLEVSLRVFTCDSALDGISSGGWYVLLLANAQAL